MSAPAAYAPWLWGFTFLFFLRVAGQVIVAIFHPRWLPPMEQWYSGLMPYPYLLPAQILILALLVAIDRDVAAGAAGAGFFARPRPVLGRWLIGLSYLYALGMVVRYVVRMALHPEQRWLGGVIPIVFHCILAAFLFTYGRYQARRAAFPDLADYRASANIRL